MIPFSILDLAPITENGTAADSFRRSVELALVAEESGYHRFWLAEHHNMQGIASAATSVVIGHVAGSTRRIRVGAGGVMLPNHSPLVIAEQFGTLETLYPGRIDLGLGRAPGSDQATARALRRDPEQSTDHFPQDVLELQAYFRPAQEGQRIRAVPGEGLEVPLWILGSSLFGAQLAAALGLPFAFAAHFAPDYLAQAFEIYRHAFEPSSQLNTPYAMVAINVLIAETDEEAAYHFTSQQQAFINLRRRKTGRLQPPVADIREYASPEEMLSVEHALQYSFVGSEQTVEQGLRQFLSRFRPDELMVTGHVYDQRVRLDSYRRLAALRERLEQHA